MLGPSYFVVRFLHQGLLAGALSLLCIAAPVALLTAGDYAITVCVALIMPLFLAFSIAWIALTIALLVWQCPRCGKSFHRLGIDRTNLFSRQCLNCGLEAKRRY